MKKKQLARVLTMAMTAGMLVPYGAAAEEATEAETTGTEAAAGEVKDPFDYDYVSGDVDADLTIYRYYADTDKVNLDYAINKMQEKYPNLTFAMEHRTDSDGSTLRTWAAVGELPDIFEINSAEVYKTLKDDGTLYVVDNEVENTKFYDLFSNGEAAKEARTADDGHQYGFGCEASNLGELFYNKELFDITVAKDTQDINVTVVAKQPTKLTVNVFGLLADQKANGTITIKHTKLSGFLADVALSDDFFTGIYRRGTAAGTGCSK